MPLFEVSTPLQDALYVIRSKAPDAQVEKLSISVGFRKARRTTSIPITLGNL